MNNNQMRKTLELLGEATNEINPLFFHGNEVTDAWEELPAVAELYRYIEGILESQR